MDSQVLIAARWVGLDSISVTKEEESVVGSLNEDHSPYVRRRRQWRWQRIIWRSRVVDILDLPVNRLCHFVFETKKERGLGKKMNVTSKVGQVLAQLKQSKENVLAEFYDFFLDILINVIRITIASCMEDSNDETIHTKCFVSQISLLYLWFFIRITKIISFLWCFFFFTSWRVRNSFLLDHHCLKSLVQE